MTLRLLLRLYCCVFFICFFFFIFFFFSFFFFLSVRTYEYDCAFCLWCVFAFVLSSLWFALRTLSPSSAFYLCFFFFLVLMIGNCILKWSFGFFVLFFDIFYVLICFFFVILCFFLRFVQPRGGALAKRGGCAILAYWPAAASFSKEHFRGCEDLFRPGCITCCPNVHGCVHYRLCVVVPAVCWKGFFWCFFFCPAS